MLCWSDSHAIGVCVCLARVANINCDSELKVFMILL